MTVATAASTLPRLLSGVDGEGAVSLAAHLDLHGDLPPQARSGRRGGSPLIDEVERAGLRGRGGAGFPTAVKLHAVAGARSRGRTVVVNGVEGEPASFKDRALLESAPHLVLDGAIAAAAAVGAREIALAVRSDASRALRSLEHALTERASRRETPEVQLVAVPPAFVAGHESAVVSYLNGAPAKPTFTPPSVHESGVRGRPTLVSNVETFAHIALIARHGADWFRALGPPQNPGSALVTLSGPVAYPGVYEIAHGTSLQALIDGAGGLIQSARALLLGGYSGAWMDARLLGEMVFDDSWLGPHGASTGAGVVAVLGEGACGVAETVRVIGWLAGQSAAQCGPCVHGLAAIAERLRWWTLGAAGHPGEDHEGELARLSALVRGRGACRHPDGALRLLSSALTVFAEEFADHARHGACDACAVRLLPTPKRRHDEREGARAA